MGPFFLQTDGAGPLEVGYAVVRADFPLGGTLVFTAIADDNSINAEAAVADSPRMTQSSIPVIFNRTQNTGIAIVNPTEVTARVKIQLRNADGTAQAAQWLTFEPRQHLPRFVSEIFKKYDFKDSFEGSLLITSDVGIAAVALKLEGSLLTTFPVMEVQ